MSVVFFGDTHFHPWPKLSTVKDGINSRLLEQVKTMEQFGERLDKADVVIFLGDWLEAQGASIDRDTYHAAYSAFEGIAERCRELIIIPGNHDVVKNSIKVLRPLRKIAQVVDVPRIYHHKNDNFYLIPYTSKKDEFLGMLTHLCKTKVEGGKILCGHVGIHGAIIGINEHLVRDPLTPNAILEHVDIAVLGHYHRFQVIQNHIYYVGSPYQVDFSEMGTKNGYMVWEGNKLEFKELTSPQFWVVVIRSPNDLSNFLKNRKEADYYKLIVRTKKVSEQDLLFDSHVVVVREYKTRTKEKRVQVVIGDPTKLIDYYVDHMETDLDKLRIKDEALNIWRRREVK